MDLKYFKKTKRFKKGGSGIKPDLFWKYILSITFILIFSSCAFGLYLFLKTDGKAILPAVNINEQDLIKKERLEKALDYFEDRERKSAEILNSPSPIIDPSL